MNDLPRNTSTQKLIEYMKIQQHYNFPNDILKRDNGHYVINVYGFITLC